MTIQIDCEVVVVVGDDVVVVAVAVNIAGDNVAAAVDENLSPVLFRYSEMLTMSIVADIEWRTLKVSVVEVE